MKPKEADWKPSWFDQRVDDELPEPDEETPPLEMLYTNWKGEASWRRVRPDCVYFGSSAYHPEPQWLMDAYDVDRQSSRTFALKDVHRFGR